MRCRNCAVVFLFACTCCFFAAGAAMTEADSLPEQTVETVREEEMTPDAPPALREELAPGAFEPDAPARKKPLTLAVLDFGGQNVPTGVASSLADRFRYELMKTGTFEVMERAEMHKILEEQNFQRSDCVDQTCAVEAGQLIAVHKIITGTVARVGGIYSVNAKMLDVATGRIDENKNEDCDCPIEKVLTETMKNLARKIAGLEVEEQKTVVTVQRGDASLYVKTDPEDAGVYINGRLMDGRTPYTFENLTPGKHQVMVKKADMQASREVTLVGNKVVRIALKLQKRKNVLKIESTPSEAEIFLDRKRTLSGKPDQLTPGILYDIDPGPHTITLFKTGFADTSLRVSVKESEENLFSIDLRELADDNMIARQKHFVKHRAYRKTGRFVIAGSLGVAAAGGVVLFLAQNDYRDADDAKKTLKKSNITVGPEYDKLLKENRDKTDAGELKTYIATGLFGAAGAVGVVGFVLYF